MALPTTTPTASPSPQVIGNAFVEQYYHILHQSPESVYKFYLESSILSRPNSDGVMTSVTTTRAINEMVLSLDYKDCIAEILTVDSQPSYNDGVFILVTGCLTGQDKIQRKFTQSFYLASQEKGVYFVLNDMFRFVDVTQPKELDEMMLIDSSADVLKTLHIPDQEVACVEDHQLTDPVTPLSEELPETVGEACAPSETGATVGEEELSAVDASVESSETQQVSKPTYSVEQEEVPKKSYASIVKVAKGSKSQTPVYVPTAKSRQARAKPVKPTSAVEKPLAATSTEPAPASVAPAIVKTSVSEKKSFHDVEGHSIYIKNLPMNTTPEVVEEEFKKFGPIKPSGVQVRSHKIDNFCFGFVEFVSVESMREAIKASPIMIANRPAFVEEKKTTTRVINGVVTNSNVGGGRGRYPTGRGGFRNDNFRGGGFSGNFGFGRSDFRNRDEFSGRGRGQGYQQRVFQNGYGRMGRSGMMNQTTVSA